MTKGTSSRGRPTGVGQRLSDAQPPSLYALTQAVVCAILAPAGPQRSRSLATLYKDDRTARLPVFPILEKMYGRRHRSGAPRPMQTVSLSWEVPRRWGAVQVP
jgi:hypothetical protein